MASIKVTFTLDTKTIERLEGAADKLAIPKSEVVRDAIAEFYDRIGRLSERERTALLRTFDEVVPRIAPRSRKDVVRELADIRRSRRTGGRRTLAEQHPAG
jgi:metal-responsive CopG/Arc/MetJ family transcriptional regulator